MLFITTQIFELKYILISDTIMKKIRYITMKFLKRKAHYFLEKNI